MCLWIYKFFEISPGVAKGLMCLWIFNFLKIFLVS
jgi:hypothetical protein